MDHGSERNAQKEQRHGQAGHHRHVGAAVEAPAEAADEIHHRVEQGRALPERRQHVDRVEGATQEGERRDDQQRHHLQLLEAIGPDADDEADQAECHRCQHQEADHRQWVSHLQWHEQPRRGQDDQAEQDRLAGRRAHVAQHRLDPADRGRQELVDRSAELREVDSERGIGDALRQQRQHDQPGDDEGAIRDAAHLGYARADRRTEHHEVQRGGDHRGDDALHQRAPRSCHLERIDRPDGVPVE